MTKTDTANVDATVAQIEEMVRAGCEIVRLAVPDNDAAIALKEIRKRVPKFRSSPIFISTTSSRCWRFEAGIDKLRLNPGNIGAHERIVEVVRAAQAQKVPIRIGVNGGSLGKGSAEKIWHCDSRSDGRIGAASHSDSRRSRLYRHNRFAESL